MARKTESAVAEMETPDVLFPELDDRNPEHKKLLKLAKAYHKIREERKLALDGAKADEDEAMGKLVEAMESCELTSFKHGEVQVTLDTKKRAKVKLVTTDEDEEPATD